CGAFLLLAAWIGYRIPALYLSWGGHGGSIRSVRLYFAPDESDYLLSLVPVIMIANGNQASIT
ncbi:MAG TPA: hypothetical protein VNZ55_00150, partial [Thermomicrobiales bacterium]|nr:hypothetical protein [Thermomicrobiales bacterium]